MKKITLIAIGVVIAATSFTSCKKGENDPFLSFKSRKGRLAGDWELTDGEVTNTFTSGGTTSTSTQTYDGSTTTYTYTGGSMTNVYTMEWTMGKDGSWEQSINDDGDIETSEGFWQFVGKSKTGEFKNKERILITETQYTDNNGTDKYEGKSNVGDQIYTLDKLSSKEIIILMDAKSVNENGDLNETTGTVTLTKK